MDEVYAMSLAYHPIFDCIQMKDDVVYVVYEYYDYDGNLLYVGSSKDFYNAHFRNVLDTEWGDEIFAICLYPYDSQEEINIGKRQRIASKKPKYNRFVYKDNGMHVESPYEEVWITNSELCMYWYVWHITRRIFEVCGVNTNDILHKRNMIVEGVNA